MVDALIRKVFHDFNSRRELLNADDHSGLDGVVTLLRSIRQHIDDHPLETRALFGLMFDALGADADLRERMTSFHAAMRADIADLVRRGVADGSITTRGEPEQVAVIVVAILRGIAYQWLLDPDAISPVEAYEVATNLLYVELSAG